MSVWEKKYIIVIIIIIITYKWSLSALSKVT